MTLEKSVVKIIKNLDSVRMVTYLFNNRKYYPNKNKSLRKEFRDILGGHGLQKLIDNFKFNTVLDIGSGDGSHSEILKEYGKLVTSLDYGQSSYFEKCKDKNSCIVGDFLEIDFAKPFDCVWCSHVLEHQSNPNEFLKNIFRSIKEGGVLAITVPPFKPEIVSGHVNIYNAGILLYQLILAGFDCFNAKVLSYGYNISVIVEKKSITKRLELTYDVKDMDLLKAYFPHQLQKSIDKRGSFDGDIESINW